jgi:hypothetical protein
MRSIRMSRMSFRTPRAAGIAGVLFAVLFGTAVVLVGISEPADPSEVQSWLSDPHKRGLVSVALNLVPFAGIAFLWFVGVIRDRVGAREDRLFATVFLGSGLLFVSMMFVASAVAASVIATPVPTAGDSSSSGVWGLGREVTFTLLNVYATRMGGVFILSTTGIGRRTNVIPTWLTAVGIFAGVALLIGSGSSLWVDLILPAWALLLSVDILLNNGTVESPASEFAVTASAGEQAGGVSSVGDEAEK